MDSDHFDRLTRMLGHRFPRRRAGVLLSALTLGFAAGSPRHAAEARKNKHKGEEKCNGRWYKRCPPGKTRSLSSCACFCIDSLCCPDEKQCGSIGNCIPKDECCDAIERTCRKTIKRRGKKKTVTFCVTRPACCPGEQTCPIAAEGCCNTVGGEVCTEFDGCCNTLAGDEVCDGKWCCQPNEKCCPGEGCIPNTQCCAAGGSSCPSDPKRCCEANEKCCAGLGCRPTTDACCVLSCPSSPIGCCQQGEICTTGTYNGVPRASCCNPEELSGLLGPCDGVCCATNPAVSTCCPGCSNPCRAIVAGCDTC